MPASNVICFEAFRSRRERPGEENKEHVPAAAAGTVFHARLASVLGPRQIAHRRAMLDFGRHIRGLRLDALRAEARERE